VLSDLQITACKLEDAKGAIKSRNLKARQHNNQNKKDRKSLKMPKGLSEAVICYPFGVFKLFLSFFFWLLCCLTFKLRLLIARLASSSFSCPFYFGYSKRKRTRKA
jgi:hypothetical protein